MEDKLDIGLVITGLIDDKTRGFNSNQNISILINKYSHLFNNILITTWTDQKKYLDANLLSEKIKVFTLTDPINSRDFTKKEIMYNDFRINYQCYKSICQLNNKYILKIRSDMMIDLKSSVEHFFKEIERKKNLNIENYENIICATSFRLDLPYGVGDLFFIGKNHILKDFFYAQVKLKKFRFNLKFGSNETEIVKRYLFTIRKKIKGFEVQDFFPMLKKNILTESTFFDKKNTTLWQYAIKNLFTILRDDISSNIKLRGKLLYKDIGRKDSAYDLWLESEKDYVKTFLSEAKKMNSFSTTITYPYFLRVCFAKIYEFKFRKKSPFYLNFFTTIYFMINEILFFINRIHKKISKNK